MYDRLCLFCKHFYFYTGSPGYSERTPGDSAVINCDKRHWEVRMFFDDEADFRKYLLSALECEDFELVEMDWLDKPVEFKKG